MLSYEPLNIGSQGLPAIRGNALHFEPHQLRSIQDVTGAGQDLEFGSLNVEMEQVMVDCPSRPDRSGAPATEATGGAAGSASAGGGAR